VGSFAVAAVGCAVEAVEFVFLADLYPFEECYLLARFLQVGASTRLLVVVVVVVVVEVVVELLVVEVEVGDEQLL